MTLSSLKAVRICAGLAIAPFFALSLAFAQQASSPHPRHHSHRRDHLAVAAAAVKPPVTAPPAPAPPPNPSDMPAKPARVTLGQGTLTVAADNSNLSEILKEVAHQSGMTIDGLHEESRVFGIYGPASPRAVLAELLADTGYNFVMVGATPSGAPRQLDLTPQGGPASAAVAPAPAIAAPAPPESPIQPLPSGADPNAQNRMQMRLQQMQRMTGQAMPQPDENNPQ